jgi:hypothetical protein
VPDAADAPPSEPIPTAKLLQAGERDYEHVYDDEDVAGGVRCEPPVEQAELVLIVADPELHIRRRAVDVALEVRLGAEQFRIPPCRRRQVVGDESDRGEPSQHRAFLSSTA